MERKWWENKVKDLGYMENKFLIYASITIDILWFSWGMKNHKTMIKSLYIDEKVKNWLYV